MKALKDYTTICSSAPSELLALMGLRSRDAILAHNRELVRRNVEGGRASSRVARFLSWIPPQGGTVCFPRLTDDGRPRSRAARRPSARGSSRHRGAAAAVDRLRLRRQPLPAGPRPRRLRGGLASSTPTLPRALASSGPGGGPELRRDGASPVRGCAVRAVGAIIVLPCRDLVPLARRKHRPPEPREEPEASCRPDHASERIRNVAIIAHIDHGKTTLIDSIFRAAHVFRDNQRVEERVMDSNDLERERGITIRSKHCTVEWDDYLINIVDTPGHADFSGEVERVLSMVDSVLLLVDANEGPMPQTRYVLMRALRLGLRPIVVVNKVDRPNADPHGALDKTFDLFLELGANDDQADFPVVYGSALEGWIVHDPETDPHEGMDALFETIVKEVPPPKAKLDAPFRMQISTLAWSDYLGRIGCGRVLEGTHRRGDELVRTSTRWLGLPDGHLHEKKHGRHRDAWEVTGTENTRSAHLWVTRGLEREEVDEIHGRRHRLGQRPGRHQDRRHALGRRPGRTRRCRPWRSKSRPCPCSSWSTTARSRAKTARR